MIPVQQTSFGNDGDCFSACVASILELPITKVPRPFRGTLWLVKWRRWLRPYGLSIEWFVATERHEPMGYSILTCEATQDYTHAVVAYNGVPVHDPKDRNVKWARGAKKSHWYVFTTLDPAATRKQWIS